MVKSTQMDNIHSLLVVLKVKGWTNASIADEIGVTVNAVEKWQSGERNISQSRLILLNQLIKKIPPKKRRYATGSRKSASDKEPQNG
jgi:transcriptional regulator with XRE-family HTH domain